MCDPLFLTTDNTTIVLDSGVTMTARAGYGASDILLRIDAASNIVIHGNFATFNMPKAEYTSGESRHCIRIFDCHNLSIYDLHANDSGGDGFAIGGATDETCSDILLSNCSANNNRRLGASITNVLTCNVLGGKYSNSIGADPQAGIDIEPNVDVLDGYEIQNVNIIGVRTEGNEGAGISVVIPDTETKFVSVNIDKHTSFNDGQNGGFLVALGGVGLSAGEKIGGSINYTNAAILSAQTAAILIQDNSDKSPYVNIENVRIVDIASNIALSDTSATFRVGVHVFSSPGADGVSQGNIRMSNVDVFDSRGTPRTIVPVWINNGASPAQPNKDLLLENITGNAFTTDTKIEFNAATTNDNVIVRYATEEIITKSASISLLTGDHIGTTLQSAGTAVTYNLPLASDALGSEYSFYVDTTGIFVSIGLLGTDVIEGATIIANAGLRSSTLGSRITVKAFAADTWRTVSISGTWVAF